MPITEALATVNSSPVLLPSPIPTPFRSKIRRSRRNKKHIQDKFTDQELKFVDLIVQGVDKLEAFESAGYKASSPAREYWKILNKPKIQRLLKLRRDQDERARDVEKPYVIETIRSEIEYLRSNTERSAAASQAILRASELLGKYVGMFVERAEVDNRITVTIERVG